MMRRTATRLASAEELGETKFKKRWDLGQYVIKGVIHQDMLGASRSRKATRAGTAGFGLKKWRDSYEARHNPHERAMDPSTTASYYTDQRIHQTFKGLTTQTVEPRMFTREQLEAAEVGSMKYEAWRLYQNQTPYNPFYHEQSWRKRYSRANKKQRAEDEVRRAAARGVTPEKYLTIAELAALQAKNEERERQSLAQ